MIKCYMGSLFQLKQSLHKTAFRVQSAIKSTLESSYWRERPQTLAFEITSICDAKCIHCPRQEMERAMRPMDLELFRRMIDQAAELKIPELFPNGYGEILTLRNLEDYLGYIRSKDHPFKISINTNGHLMTPDKMELFFKYKVDLLNINTDGATIETAEKIRVNLDITRVENNIKNLLRIRKERNLTYPKVRVGIIIIPQNAHEVEAFSKKWEGVADFVGIAGFSNRAGSLNEKFSIPITNETTKKASACTSPFKDLNIFADGKAVICCEDWNEEHVVGNLNTSSLKEIWHGEEFRKVREKHLQSRGADIEICKKCHYWREPRFGEKLWS